MSVRRLAEMIMVNLSEGLNVARNILAAKTEL